MKTSSAECIIINTSKFLENRKGYIDQQYPIHCVVENNEDFLESNRKLMGLNINIAKTTKITEYNNSLHLAFIEFLTAFEFIETCCFVRPMNQARIDCRY